MTGFKNIVATLYLKNGQAVKSASDMTVMGDVYNLCQLYNDSGIDKIIIFDLSTDDDEHEKTLRQKRRIVHILRIIFCTIIRRSQWASLQSGPIQPRMWQLKNMVLQINFQF